MPDDLQIESLWQAHREIAQRVRTVEKFIDTVETPTWRRIVFMLDGWPLWRVVERPQWRPWRHWWTS